jgi:hypothetical protein
MSSLARRREMVHSGMNGLPAKSGPADLEFEGSNPDSAPRPAVLLIGDHTFHEFAECVAWLAEHTDLTTVGTIAAAMSLMTEPLRNWDTLVIAQARPGQFTQIDVEQLSRTLPLTPLVALLGSCCEGETRSGKPWPGVVRIYWHQWLARVPSELSSGRSPTTWHLPKTASDAERVDFALRCVPPSAAGLVAICTPDAAFSRALEQACKIAGYTTVWIRDPAQGGPHESAAVLWHCTGSDELLATQIRAARRSWCHSPIIGLCGFPRYDQVALARRCGISAIVSLPFLLPDLWNTLRSIHPS